MVNQFKSMRLIIIILVFLTACKGWDEWADAEDDAYSGPYSILNNWNGTNEDPVLKNLEVNTTEQSYNYLSCEGDFVATQSATGIGQGLMVINSNSADQGTISFGPLAYQGAANPNCELFSEKVLDYTISESTLTVCLRPASLNQCFSYAQI